MGLFGGNSKKIKELESQVTELKAAKTVNPNTILFNDAYAVFSGGSPKSNIDNGYLGADDVYSIIRKIARTAAMIPLYVYQVKDEKALKEYEFHTKQQDFSPQGLLKNRVLRTKALEAVPEDNELQSLLDKPNSVYSKTEFREGVYAFRLATGNTYIYLDLLELGPNKGKPAEMHLMPSQYTRPIVTRTFPRQITGYQMDMTTIEKFTPEEVMQIRYFNPQFTYNGDELIGLSPLRAGSKILDRQKSEVDYSVSSFQNAGATGIVTREDYEESRDPAFGAMKSDYYAETSGTKNAKKSFFTGGKWNYIQIGLSPVDMDLLASEVKTFKRLCNLYGVSDILFNNGDASTESNVKEMVKALYTNAALPEVYAFRDGLNSKVTPLFNKKGVKYFIDCDITSISELQEDMKRMAEIFNNLPIMIPNLIMEAFGYGKSTDTNMDKVFVKAGYTELDNLANVPDITE